MKKTTIITTVSILFFIFSALVGTIFGIFGLVLIFFSFVLAVLSLKSSIVLKDEDRHIILLFFLVPFFLFSLNIIRFFINGLSFLEFYPSVFGRMYNLVVYFVLSIYFINIKNKNVQISTKHIIILYYYGCCILLFFGLWQLSNVLFGIPYPNFETRNRIHSIDTALLPTFMKIRITSISEEPAYLIPRLMDAIIICIFCFKRKIMAALYTVVLFFTLSLSGYVNFAVIAFIILFLSKKNKQKLIFFVLLLLVMIFLLPKILPIFGAIFIRLKPELLFRSGRVQDSILSIKYMFSEAPLFNFIFGFGPKGMGYIRQFVFYPSGRLKGEMIAITSHIIFVDFFVEYGLFGLVLLILFFYYIYQLAVKTYTITKNRLSQLLCINLFITSFYTSDFASPRLFIIILLILFLFKDTKTKKAVCYV
jgi:hypothetical protein